MRIILSNFSTSHKLIPLDLSVNPDKYDILIRKGIGGAGYRDDERNFLDNYIIYWGVKDYDLFGGAKYGVMETGFFSKAAFIDTIGNYQHSSLNTKDGYASVAGFQLGERKSAKEIIFSLPSSKQSKYNPYLKERLDLPDKWKGPVLILQKPRDRSILSSTSRQNYAEFVRSCCKFYGKELFVKLHPYNATEDEQLLRDIAKSYGCKCGKVELSFIEEAEFCIGYNSGFVIDAILRGIPYVQYAVGTFFNAYGINYSNYTFPTQVKFKEDSERLCDFLIYKYCFNRIMSPEKFAKMLHLYAGSKKLFPMTSEFSYANNLPV